MKTLFTNANILDIEKGKLVLGSVEVTDGTITNVGNNTNTGEYDRIIDCKGNILMPGFVNTHCHTPMTLLRSLKDDAPLNEWLFDNVLPTEAKITPEDVYWGEYLGIAESVRGGITAIEEGYFHNSRVSEVLKKSGMRGRIGIGPAMRDIGMSNVEYLEQCAKDINNSDKVQTSCFIHAVYTTSEKAIRESIEFADKNNIALSIHLSETEKENSEHLAKTGLTPTQYLEKLGFFKHRCLCYHCVDMTDNDIDILRNNKSSVATCPSSNLKLGSGIAPIVKMFHKGINISIGTDGVASNNSLDMFKEMFLVATLCKVCPNGTGILPVIDILRMATINGAKALGINSGEIKTGKNADIILIDIHQPHYYPHDNLLSHLVYSGKSSDVCLTMIDGKIVYENGQYNIGEDIEQIYKNSNQIRARLLSK